MWYESPLFFVFWATWFWVGHLLDANSSQHFEWYGLEEGNKLIRTKDGTFDATKDTILTVVYFAVSCLIGVVAHSWGAGCALLIVGGPFLTYQSFVNKSAKKQKRAQQIAILTAFRNDPDAPEPNLGMMITMNGRSYFELFHFLSLPLPAGSQDTINAVWAEIKRYAHEVPPEQWFKY
jgi:hypothetical protein